MTFREVTEHYLLKVESTTLELKNFQKRREQILLMHVLPAIGDLEISEVYSSNLVSEEAFRRIRAGTTTEDDFMKALDAMNTVLRLHFHNQF